ncbi:MAG: PAS domain-containing sensor histidine kinase [Pseudolabrys sp.]|nr:PAS domain-containing sensor histidine kinase [Pseudolabrys sp.]
MRGASSIKDVDGSLGIFASIRNYVAALVCLCARQGALAASLSPLELGGLIGAVVRHRRNGAATFVSSAAPGLFGVSSSELIGQGVFDRIHVVDRPAYLKTLIDSALAGEARSVECRIRRDQESASAFAWAEMRCRPVDGSNEIIAVIRDISDRKAQEQALEDARAESERANAGKGRFLATMSHELRTPLNAIIGFSDMLTNEQIELDDSRRKEYARLINDAGRHLLSVVNGILDMSKMEAGSFEITLEPIAPKAVIVSCCDLLALKANQNGIELRTLLETQLPEIVADRRALSQILLNLVSNALKFTDRGGSVSVSAERDGNALVIAVEDTGVGIGEEDLPRIGEAFFQARSSYDRRHDGTGLGLSIVKGLVRLHGGELKITSRLGEGTRVTVRLPVDCEGHRLPVEPIVLKSKKTDFAVTDNRMKKSA